MLVACPAAADWTEWTVADGTSPICWEGGERIAFLTPAEEDVVDLVTCRWDGGEARVLAEVPASAELVADPSGNFLIAGSELLVPTALGAPVALRDLVMADQPIAAAALSRDAVRVAFVTESGAAHVADVEGGRPIARGPYRYVDVSSAGDRLLLVGPGSAEVRAAEDGRIIYSGAADAAVLTGDGDRLVAVVGSELRRIRLPGGEVESTVDLPWTPDSLAAGEWGQRILVGRAGEVLSITWTGSELRPVAHSAVGWSASPDGDAVTWSSGGRVHLAVHGLAEPPQVGPLDLQPARGVPPFDELLTDLLPLARDIAAGAQGAAPAPGEIVRDSGTGWGLVGHPSAPFVIGVPPGWTVETVDGGLDLEGPEGEVEVLAVAGGGTSARELVAAEAGRDAEPRRGLLAGMESWSATAGDGLQIIAVDWRDGTLLLRLTWTGERPAVLDQLLDLVTPAPAP